MGNPTNILDLPLEILDLIFNKLSFGNKLKLGQADNILGEAFVYHHRNEYKKISSRILPLENWSDFLSICGPIVEEVDVDGLEIQYFKLIEQHCCNLKIISKLYMKDFKCSATRSLFRGAKSLTSLETKITSDTTAKVIHVLQEATNFKILNITYFGEGQDDSSSGVTQRASSLDLAKIHKLVHLEELTISSDPFEGSFNIMHLPSQLKMLRFLTFSNIKVNSLIEEVDLTCPALEELNIYSSQIEFQLPFCPKLRSLKIITSKYSSNNLKWLSKHIVNLETLQADSKIFQKNILLSIFSSKNFKEWEFPKMEQLTINASEIKFPLPFCPRLKSLKLSSTSFFSMNFFFKWISKHESTLEELEITFELFKANCRLTKLSNIQSQKWTLPSLKKLQISHHLISYDLPYCPNLQNLNLEYASCQSMDYFYTWIGKHTNSLECLQLTENLFEETKFLEILPRCQKITKFYISTFPKKISFGFLKSFINILKNNGFSSINPFEIRVPSNEFQHIKRILAVLPNCDLCKCLERRNHFDDLPMDFFDTEDMTDRIQLILNNI
ncbi:uncharacterized protein [Drosophila takahashii]|uniref:uncharacterized protein n=1 Tax=Drosophila takahashii TaxID=29030 RepID=UPI00389913FD